MKYKVGDRVKVKNKKELEILDGTIRGIGVNSSMLEIAGQTVIIKECWGRASYHFEGSQGNWNWIEEFIEGYADDVARRMEVIAELFGLKLGEKFEIDGECYNPYQFTKEGLFDRDGDRSHNNLGGLLHGVSEIKKSLNPKIEEQLKELAKEMDRLSEKLKALENGEGI